GHDRDRVSPLKAPSGFIENPIVRPTGAARRVDDLEQRPPGGIRVRWQRVAVEDEEDLLASDERKLLEPVRQPPARLLATVRDLQALQGGDREDHVVAVHDPDSAHADRPAPEVRFRGAGRPRHFMVDNASPLARTNRARGRSQPCDVSRVPWRSSFSSRSRDRRGRPRRNARILRRSRFTRRRACATFSRTWPPVANRPWACGWCSTSEPRTTW